MLNENEEQVEDVDMTPIIKILAAALVSARPFVWRAKNGVKAHEQDAKDAAAWFEKYGDLLDILKSGPRR